jgi:hypothetical protein
VGPFQGTYDFSEFNGDDSSTDKGHTVLDVIPHVIIGSGYPGNQTTVYTSDSFEDDNENDEEEECSGVQ